MEEKSSVENMDKMVEIIIALLEEKSKPGRIELSKTYYPTSMRVLGVKVPDQRGVVKWLKDEIKQWPVRGIINLSIALTETKIYEAQQVAYELIGKSKKLVSDLTKADLKALAIGLDNWASVDAYSIYLFGIKWRQGIIADKDVMKLLGSDNRWERRVAVVSTVALNQKAHGGTGDPDRTLMICEKVVDDKDDLYNILLSLNPQVLLYLFLKK